MSDNGVPILGQLPAFRVGHNGEIVIIEFDFPLDFVGLTPETARQLAEMLSTKADEIDAAAAPSES